MTKRGKDGSKPQLSQNNRVTKIKGKGEGGVEQHIQPPTTWNMKLLSGFSRRNDSSIVIMRLFSGFSNRSDNSIVIILIYQLRYCFSTNEAAKRQSYPFEHFSRMPPCVFWNKIVSGSKKKGKNDIIQFWTTQTLEFFQIQQMQGYFDHFRRLIGKIMAGIQQQNAFCNVMFCLNKHGFEKDENGEKTLSSLRRV